jgi:uncharacterized membrane protein YfcA
LAGNGSAITLTLLTELIGLPGNVANATNRVGALTQSIAGAYAFHRNGRLDLRRDKPYLALTITGAIAGLLAAAWVSGEQFMIVFKVFLVVMFFVILVKPARWLRETDLSRPVNLWFAAPVFLLIGFYGGFIQMGMGIFFLAAMVLGARYSLIDANAVKSAVIGMYTVLGLAIFAARGLIDWKVGLIFAAGQTVSGYYTAIYASRFPNANLWAYRLLVVIVLLAIVKLFDLHRLLVR